MSDSFTEVTSESWFGRLGNSIKGVLVGVVLFLVAFPVLWWNEGRAVKTAKALEEGKGIVVSVSADEVDPANEGKLVHLTGEATTEETLEDPEFGMSATALRMKRSVEMYQWDEDKQTRTRKKLGGGRTRETTYTYDKEWSERVIDSSNFRKPEGHENPGAMPYAGKERIAEEATIGAFKLTDSLLNRIDRWEALAASNEHLEAASLEDKSKLQLHAGGFYAGANPASPEVGDARITFQIVKPTTVSLFSRQVKDTFEPYPTKAGRMLERLEVGTKSAEAMFEQAMKENAMMTWILRGAGFLIMAIGIGMVLNPLVVVADVVPFLGDLLGLGIAVCAGLVAFALSLITVAIAWVAYRPIVGIPLLIVGVGVIVLGKVMAAKKKASPQPEGA